MKNKATQRNGDTREIRQLMQCGVLDWMAEKKQDPSGETLEIQI